MPNPFKSSCTWPLYRVARSCSHKYLNKGGRPARGCVWSSTGCLPDQTSLYQDSQRPWAKSLHCFTYVVDTYMVDGGESGRESSLEGARNILGGKVKAFPIASKTKAQLLMQWPTLVTLVQWSGFRSAALRFTSQNHWRLHQQWMAWPYLP